MSKAPYAKAYSRKKYAPPGYSRYEGLNVVRRTKKYAPKGYEKRFKGLKTIKYNW